MPLILILAFGLVLAPISTHLTAQVTFEEHTVNVAGVDLYYRTAGDGPPLLMLHGMNGIGRTLDSLATRLAEHYSVIVPDLPAHGKSGGEFDFPDGVISTMLGFIDQLGYDRIAALGYSIGGVTLLNLATQAPDRIAALVILAAGHRYPAARREWNHRNTVFELLSDERRARLIERHGDEDRAREVVRADRALSEDIRDLSVEELKLIGAPTFLVWGEKDASFPLPIPIEMQQALPTAELWLIADANHSLLSGDAADRIRRILPAMIIEFLRANDYPNEQEET
jgi:pimeloyl-ACP methyl ester carboxylesterase